MSSIYGANYRLYLPILVSSPIKFKRFSLLPLWTFPIRPTFSVSIVQMSVIVTVLRIAFYFVHRAVTVVRALGYGLSVPLMHCHSVMLPVCYELIK